LLAAAAVMTCIAIAYTVENWRGKRAWENCRRELEGRGEVLDWSAYVPAPVPDEKNFFKAPNMREWFVKESSSIKNSLASKGAAAPNAAMPFALSLPERTKLVVAEVKIALSNQSTDSQGAGGVLRFDDPAAADKASKLLRDSIGPCAIGARQCVLVAQRLEQFKPLHLVLQADKIPSVKELAAFFPSNPLTNSAMAYSDVSYMQVEAAGNKTFSVSLKAPVYSANELLDWTESLTADFDQVRKALERPYAQIETDSEQPFLMPIPNFIGIRAAVQILSQRAQSYLVLGKPEAAWHELALIHDLNQVLLLKPSGKPITLVGAMIHVAVEGLFAGIVEDGLRLHAWHEPQLLEIEQQLKKTDLLGPVVEAFREERAATSRTFETTRRSELVKLFAFEGPSKKVITFMPRGWFYQNMAAGAKMEQEALISVDLNNIVVLPRKVTELVRELASESERRSPYRFLVAVALPNFAKALQKAAADQTLVEQARIGCALERLRLAQGQYLERLEALTPAFMEELPHDLIGGRPLNYRRTEGGGYLLYSVGWDERDDGGFVGKSRDEGDWVWEIR
jgi:hypothetical protein